MKAADSWHTFLINNPLLFPLIYNISLNDPEVFLSFLVDPTTTPSAISLAQSHKDIDVIGKLCYLSRMWLYILHKEHLVLLDLWNKT